MSTTAKKVDQTLNQELAAMDDTNDWETRVIVVGGILGAVVGLLTSYLLIRTSKEAHAGPPAITHRRRLQGRHHRHRSGALHCRSGRKTTITCKGA